MSSSNHNNNNEAVPASSIYEAFGMSEQEQFNTEDAPEMRSIAIGGISSGPGLYSAGPGAFNLKSASNSHGGSLGFSKPAPLGAIKPVAGFSKGAPFGLSKPSLGLRSTSVKQEWSAVSTAAVWNVKNEDLEPVPEDYPLERTHRAIFGADATIVASRISAVLRELSIEADFDTEKAKAKCKTGDLVSFRIRLYSGDEEGGEPVIVEVQRRSGSTSSFMRSCRSILNAAEGKAVGAAPVKKMPFSTPLGQMSCLAKEMQKPHDYEAEAKSELDRIVDMLRNKHRTSNRLAMENLYSLTDPVKTSHSVAVYISKCVALGDITYDIREDIRAFTDRDAYGSDIDDEEVTQSANDQLRQLALAVFANSMRVCAKEGVLADAVAEQKWFADCLLPTLVQEIKRAHIDTCNACSATSTLRSLVLSSTTARDLFVGQGGVPALQAAVEFGEVRHALLATEAQKCLQAMEAHC